VRHLLDQKGAYAGRNGEALCRRRTGTEAGVNARATLEQTAGLQYVAGKMEVAMAGNSTKRVQKHRAKMKAAGLRRVTIWVPDINAPGYREKIRKECELINASADSNRVMDEMLAVADSSDWKA
jgi:Antitoxin MazE-like